MEEQEGKIKVVTRTQVYLDDPEFFCNKSWTLSFNMNTKRWISFHSYLPNWYIGENNFFYSGKNDCCGDVEGSFLALAGELNRDITTTTTSTIVPITTTTSSTTAFTIDCTLIGTAFDVDCILDGTAVITVPPTTTTTICQRPSWLVSYTLYKGYQITGDPEVITSNSLLDTCESFSIILSPVDKTLVSFTCMSTNNDSLEVGQILYDTDYLTDCSLVADGWYYTLDSLTNKDVIHVVDGVIVEIANCDCPITTTTTTTLIIPECCGVLIISNDGVYLLNVDNGYSTNMITLPGFLTSDGLAMTPDYLWSWNNTEITQWDITLNPFTATYNRTIAYPMGYLPGPTTALNNDVLIAIDRANYPTSVDVVELDITNPTASLTYKFTIADINPVSNLLYTIDGKLIFVYEDLISGDSFLTQYDYSTNTLELNINLGIVVVTSVFECNCSIYYTDDANNVYNVNVNSPYDITPVGQTLIPVLASTQPNTCVPSSLEETTTTTTTIP